MRQHQVSRYGTASIVLEKMMLRTLLKVASTSIFGFAVSGLIKVISSGKDQAEDRTRLTNADMLLSSTTYAFPTHSTN